MTHPFNTMTYKHNEYITPPYIIESLGRFDLDPCGCPTSPIPTASKEYTLPDQDGLLMPWYGRVWLNPPYGRFTGEWIAKLADHGKGTALIFARTDVDFFHRYVFKRASGIMFLRGRLHFYDAEGKRYKDNAGAPSCLVTYGIDDWLKLARSRLDGEIIRINA